jgi:shikimate kinase
MRQTSFCCWTDVNFVLRLLLRVGRNILRGPNYFDTDFTLQKSFGVPTMKIFGENAQFEFRADFYNIFNQTNVTNLNKVISTDGKTSNPLFGQAQNALGARVVEL